MPHLVWMRGLKSPDGSVAKKITQFFMKLSEDDTLPGLHIEPIRNSADQRVRTGRVDDFWRAVMFRIEAGSEPTYVVTGIYAHDEAIAVAQRLVLRTNPINGLPEVIERDVPVPVPARAPVPESAPASVPANVPVGAASTEATSPSKAPVVAPVVTSRKILAPAKRPVPTAPQWVNPLLRRGLSPYDLDDAGIDPGLAAKVLAADTQPKYSALINGTSDLKGLIILALAAGKSTSDVERDYGVKHQTVRSERSDLPVDQRTASALGLKGYLGAHFEPATDAEVLTAIQSPLAKTQFVLIADQDQLKGILEHGSMAEWRTFLHPDQHEYAYKPSNKGPFRLTGGAGTGKTVVVIHRANYLAQHNPDARIVLTTFTTVLANSLQQQMRLLNPNIKLTTRLGGKGLRVSGLDALASEIVKGATDAERAAATERLFGVATSQVLQQTGDVKWANVLDELGLKGTNPHLLNTTFLEEEYVSVILANHITKIEQYALAPRVGRGTRVGRAQRIQIFKVVEAYRRALRLNGRSSFAEVLALAAAILDARAAAGQPRLADHVVMDEAQDFHAGHWMVLRALVEPGENDLFIATDGHQRIYGQKIVLSRFGISVRGQRSKALTLNYRTTANNLAFAVKVLEGHAFSELGEEEETPIVDEVLGYRSARSGPEPRLLEAASSHDEIEKIAAVVREWREEFAEHPERVSVAILVRQRRQIGTITGGLNDLGIDAGTSRNPLDGTVPQVLTMHSSKGMEFSHVILANVSDDAMPSRAIEPQLAETEREESLLRERSLLYVAATRARDELVITFNGQPSEMLPEA